MSNDNNNAVWIRDPGFVPQNNPVNIHTLFRKTFTLGHNGLSRAILYFTADDHAWLYINGNFLQCSPAPGYLHQYYYQMIDLTPYIKPGKNCIAVHNYYQGLVNRVWNSADGFCGIFARLEMAYDDGHTETIVTDNSWRCSDCDAYRSERKYGYDTQFAEDIDMRKMPVGWESVSFDDAKWKKAAVAEGYPHQLVRQETAALNWAKILPKEVKKLADGHYLIDFGREVVGCTAVKTHGPAGTIVEIRHAEELDEHGNARFNLRAFCVYQEYATLSGRDADLIRFFDYKAFRYVELLNLPQELVDGDIFVCERTYPFSENASSFTSAHQDLNGIWDICRLAVKLGTQDSYLDCMTREKGAYLGDAYVTGQSHLYLTGKTAMLKKVLSDFAASTRFCPGIKAVAPGAFMQDIADYSLLWPSLLLEYYKWSGDSDLIEESQQILEGLLDFFGKYENDEGLLSDFTAMPILVDWPQNLRDDYDDPNLMGAQTPETGINTVINLYYYRCFDAIAKMMTILGKKIRSAKMEQRKSKLQSAVMAQLFRDGLFRDTAISNHASLHANALALAVGIIPDDVDKTPILKLIEKKRLCCGVYFSFFVLEGLFKYRQTEQAYALLTAEDKQSWITMLRAGATTCMEAWGPDQKWNTSWCHPWASAPIYMLAAEIFGLKPHVPGWSEIKFKPHIPSALPNAKLSVSIPQGRIDVSYEQDKNSIHFSLRLPPHVKAVCDWSALDKKVTVNGKTIACGTMLN